MFTSSFYNPGYLQMRILSSSSLGQMHPFYATMSLVLSDFSLSWSDLQVEENWSVKHTCDFLTTLIQELPSGSSRTCPSSVLQRLEDISSHHQFGFPRCLISKIKDYFSRSTRQGWTHSKLLAACAAVVLVPHFTKHVCTHCSKHFVSDFSLRLHSKTCHTTTCRLESRRLLPKEPREILCS